MESAGNHPFSSPKEGRGQGGGNKEIPKFLDSPLFPLFLQCEQNGPDPFGRSEK